MLTLARVITLALCGVGRIIASNSGLQIEYGGAGVEKLSYNGVILEDLSKDPPGAFHIWHMKVTDAEGKPMKGGQYEWGENNSGKSWDATNHTWIYKFNWGSISVHFGQSANTLDMSVEVINSAHSNITFDGATIYPFALHFPSLPIGFKDPTYPQLSFNTTGPSTVVADYGQGEVVAVNADASRPLYSGFLPSGSKSYTPVISGTAIDGIPGFFPHNDRPLLPGKTDRYTVSLRFGPSRTPVKELAADAYKSWRQNFPPVIRWTDRRIIGTIYLASSPSGKPNAHTQFTKNPRRYFNDPNVDFVTASGLASFQTRILKQAATNVDNLKRLNAQGAITWDIEGEEYPQTTSYVCEPDQIAGEAPEMESEVQDPSSRYHGMKLDDAYFKIMRDAGFRVGVCVRPQHFQKKANGMASQILLPDSQVVAELIRKMKYAHERWGVTLFYMDSTVDATGAPLNPGMMKQVEAAFPDSLLIPEESTPRDYAYTAPFLTFLFHGDLGTPPDVQAYYPKAFSVNLINDADSIKLAQHRSDLVDSVRRGDVLMVHADYWQANNPTVIEIYHEAHMK